MPEEISHLSWLLRIWSLMSLNSVEAGSSSWRSHRRAVYLASVLLREAQLVASPTDLMSRISWGGREGEGGRGREGGREARYNFSVRSETYLTEVLFLGYQLLAVDGV